MALQSIVFLFFFFQAEDGIRDVAVTGVQTCALPILMLGDNARGAFQKLNSAQYLLAVHRMFTHSFPLFVSELRRFSKNCVRNSDLSDVMQKRAELERLHLGTGQSVLAAQ